MAGEGLVRSSNGPFSSQEMPSVVLKCGHCSLVDLVEPMFL